MELSSSDEVKGVYKFEDGTSDSFTIYVGSITNRLDYQNNLILIGDIFLFGIIIFMSFCLALRGFWR